MTGMFMKLYSRMLTVLACSWFALSGATPAEALNIAFLSAESAAEKIGPHELGAWETARTLGGATLLLLQASGEFQDTQGAVRKLEEFQVVWYHQGDAIAYNAMYGGPAITALRSYVGNGGGALLSGGALALIDNLGVESYIRSQRRNIENYRDPAALVPEEPAHPAFAGLPLEDGRIWLSAGGCRALADFYCGGAGSRPALAFRRAPP